MNRNVLASFAQFEREVIGERVRDRIAASKKKGMWMGGMPSLGHDMKDRKLVVNQVKPPRLTAQTPIRLSTRLPIDWVDQRKLLGFAHDDFAGA